MELTYKRNLTLSLLVIIGFFLIYYLFIAYISNTTELIWIHDAIVKKEKYIKSDQASKIIFVGGSGTLFGVNTKEITNELNVPTYNMGLHAGLGLDFILDEVKNVLKSGDTVILPLEYSLLNDAKQTKLAYDYYRHYDKNGLSNIPSVKQFEYHFQNNPIEIIMKTAEAKMNKSADQAGRYKSMYMNEHGDQTNNYGNPPATFEPLTLPKELEETDNLKMVKNFNEWCKQNKIILHMTYPNTTYFSEYDNADYKKYFNFLTSYFEQNKIKTIGKPNDFFYNKELFYDTNYHLNQKGTEVRTKQLIEMMKNLNIGK